MREKLKELMKIHLRGIDRELRGKDIDVSLDSLLDDLDLPELK